MFGITITALVISSLWVMYFVIQGKVYVTENWGLVFFIAN